jgi:hypothetical protein
MDRISASLEHDLASIINEEIPLTLPSDTPKPGSVLERRMEAIESDLLTQAGGLDSFRTQAGQIIREAVDYVIDAPTLARYSIEELEPDEKTSIGKRIERLFRVKFNIARGSKLDISLGGEEVDIKTTMTNKWMFSKSSWESVNLLIAYNEEKAIFRVGLVYVIDEQLGAKNRDGKRTIRAEFHEEIRWIVLDSPYPENFLAKLDRKLLDKIRTRRSGQQRVNFLLENIPGTIIPRHAITSVANQKDPLRRLRKNGGARSPFWKKGLLVLSGKFMADKRVAEAVCGVRLEPDQFMSLRKDDPSMSEEMLSLYSSEHCLPA